MQYIWLESIDSVCYFLDTDCWEVHLSQRVNGDRRDSIYVQSLNLKWSFTGGQDLHLVTQVFQVGTNLED